MRSVFLGALFFLTGCGGSGGDNPSSTPVELILTGPQQAVSGDSVSFAITTNNGSRLDSVQWDYPAEAIKVLAPQTQVIGFDAPDAGDYVFSVTATLANGTRLTEEFSLTVTEGPAPQAVVRLGHEATEGGRVSLRVDVPPEAFNTVSTIDWQQLSGPNGVNVRFDESTRPKHNIFFTAPRVERDAIIEYQATVTFTDGTTASDSTLVLVKDVAIANEGFFPSNDMYVTDHMQPYHPGSRYADALRQCVYNNQIRQSCTFGTLPLIGQVTHNPSVDDILDRTYVSHPWMGDAFKAFLETSLVGDDLLRMLRATTAVVISYDIRPSFYWAATGAIYLDANNFWRTPAERDTLNTAPDYRSEFGNDLNYVTSWRYVKEGEYYYPQPNLAEAVRNSRDLKKVEAALAWLMYHELAHANDFFDYTSWESLSDNDTPSSYYNRNTPNSDTLARALPLTSVELHELAQVSYGGAIANETQVNYTAQDVADFFKTDGAVSFYSYYTAREDYATLVERFMMLHRLGVSSDVGVFTRDTFAEEEYLITWAQRNRVNASNIQQRVDFAVSRVFPEFNVPDIQARLPEPQLLPPGSDWFETLQSADDSGTIEANRHHLRRHPVVFPEQRYPMRLPVIDAVKQ